MRICNNEIRHRPKNYFVNIVEILSECYTGLAEKESGLSADGSGKKESKSVLGLSVYRPTTRIKRFLCLALVLRRYRRHRCLLILIFTVPSSSPSLHKNISLPPLSPHYALASPFEFIFVIRPLRRFCLLNFIYILLSPSCPSFIYTSYNPNHHSACLGDVLCLPPSP